MKFAFHRLEKVKTNTDRLNRYKRKFDSRKKIRLRKNLQLGEQILVLAKKLKKKDAPGTFYKNSTQNKSYFNKDKVFVVMKKQKIGNQYFYWLTNTKTKRLLRIDFKDKGFTCYLKIPIKNLLNYL